MVYKYTETDTLLVPEYEHYEYHLEAMRVKELFTQFRKNGFSYEEMLNRPESLIYASAETLAVYLFPFLTEMVAREPEGRYLNESFIDYPLLSAIDPHEKPKLDTERFYKLTSLVDCETVEAICNYLRIIKHDPPIPVERIEKIESYWKKRLAEMRS